MAITDWEVLNGEAYRGGQNVWMYEYMHDVHMQVPLMYVRMYMVQAMRSYNYNVQVQISVHQ